MIFFILSIHGFYTINSIVNSNRFKGSLLPHSICYIIFGLYNFNGYIFYFYIDINKLYYGFNEYIDNISYNVVFYS